MFKDGRNFPGGDPGFSVNISPAAFVILNPTRSQKTSELACAALPLQSCPPALILGPSSISYLCSVFALFLAALNSAFQGLTCLILSGRLIFPVASGSRLPPLHNCCAELFRTWVKPALSQTTAMQRLGGAVSLRDRLFPLQVTIVCEKTTGTAVLPRPVRQPPPSLMHGSLSPVCHHHPSLQSLNKWR